MTTPTPEHPDPEPAPQWQRPTGVLTRALRLIATPQGAGALVFAVSLIITVTLIAVRPGQGFIDEHVAAEEPSQITPANDDSDTETAAAEEVVVYVSGEVGEPGLVTLAAGARVADALTAAGEVSDTANIDSLNVARVLIDGEHIHVGDDADAEAPAGESAGSDTSAAATTGGLINLNHADQATLETLPGVGPAIAERIITWREANGGFHTPEDVQQVSGIGPKVFADLQPLITAP